MVLDRNHFPKFVEMSCKRVEQLNMLKQPMCPSANMKLVKRLIPLKSE
jgi:hypothetical protein